jgi:hypothetical protein
MAPALRPKVASGNYKQLPSYRSSPSPNGHLAPTGIAALVLDDSCDNGYNHSTHLNPQQTSLQNKSGTRRKRSQLMTLVALLSSPRRTCYSISTRNTMFSYFFGLVCGIAITILSLQIILFHQNQFNKLYLDHPVQIPLSIPMQRDVPMRSTIQSIRDIPYLVSKSHIGIRKQILVDEFAVHPDLVGISVATIMPGQTITMHAHTTLHEFFYIYEGEVDITVEYPISNDSTSIGKSSGRGGSSASTNNNVNTTNKRRTKTNICGYGCFFHAVPGEAHEFTVRIDAPMDTKMLMVQLVQSDSILDFHPQKHK